MSRPNRDRSPSATRARVSGSASRRSSAGAPPSMAHAGSREVSVVLDAV
jgi:hypothetical protein